MRGVPRCSTFPAPVRPAPDILIAEDELLLQEALQEALIEAGHRVAVARNGLEALAALDRMARPALVVLDLQMPVMDGLAFLDELRKRPDHGDFQILAMSATVDGEWLEHIAGVRRTLRKPFDVQEILAAADEFLTRDREAGPATAPTEQNTPVLGPATKAAGPEED